MRRPERVTASGSGDLPFAPGVAGVTGEALIVLGHCCPWTDAAASMHARLACQHARVQRSPRVWQFRGACGQNVHQRRRHHRQGDGETSVHTTPKNVPASSAHLRVCWRLFAPLEEAVCVL